MSKLLAGAMALIMLAGFQSTTSHAEDGKLVIGASEVRERIREYSNGRKLRYCYVVFTLTNKTGKALRRARFWGEAANCKRASFGLRAGKTRTRARVEKLVSGLSAELDEQAVARELCMLAERADAYGRFESVDTEDRTPDQVVDEIVRHLAARDDPGSSDRPA